MIDIADIPLLLKRHLGLLLLAPLVMVGLAFGLMTFKTPVYSSSTEILLEPEGLRVAALADDVQQQAKSVQDLNIESQAYVILSAGVLDAVAEKLDLDNDPALHKSSSVADEGEASARQLRIETLTALRKVISVKRLSTSFVFSITAEHPDAYRAAEIANATADAYISQLISLRGESIKRTADTMVKQAANLRSQIDKVELEIENYKSQNGLVSTGQGGLVVDQEIQSMSTQITQARVELEKARAAFAMITPLTVADVEKNGLPQQANPNLVLQSLQIQYANISQQLAEADTTFGSNHPARRELQSQLTNVRSQIAQELQRTKGSLKSAYDQARTTLAALENQSTSLQSQNSRQGKAQVELRRLESEAEANRVIYDAFLKRARELQEQSGLDANLTRILSRAEAPDKPTGPRKLFVIIAAAVFGFCLVAGSIIAVAILRGQITSENDLARRTGAPVLTHLPIKTNDIGHATGRMLKTFGGEALTISSQHSMAIARLSYAIRQTYADQKPATLLILATDELSDSTHFSSEIAQKLREMGENVLFARTATEASDAEATTTSIATAEARAPKKRKWASDNDAPVVPQSSHMLSRYLKVDRLDTRRKYATAANLEHVDEDLLIIDGGSAMNNPMLPVLLRHADGIVLVSSLGSTKIGQLDRTLAYLQPWRDRVIGNVVLEAA
ncbi:MAG: GumC family protein [Rhodobacteraceae bacterium]|nr:GumC family protein [Paracoccaceae bacterium]